MIRNVVLGLVCVSTVASARDAFLSSARQRDVIQPARGVVTATEPRLGVPTIYWAEPLTRGPRSLTPIEAARSHLLEVASSYRLEAARVATAQVREVHDTGQGAIIVTFQQRIDGVLVVRDEVHVVMTRELELVAITGYLTPENTKRGDFKLSASSAASAAWAAATGSLRDIDFEAVRDEAGFDAWSMRDGFVRARPVYFPLVDGVAAAFHVEVEWSGGMRAFVLSAVDADVLSEKDLVASHSYAVWADATTKAPAPNPWGPSSIPLIPNSALPVVAQTQVSLLHAGLSTQDPWLPAGATQTIGNNVRAYTDWTAPDGFTASGDAYGTVTAPGEFHVTFAPAISAVLNDAQRQVGVAHLFYVTNYLHDWFYDSGFDERAGNAQADNFSRGGSGFDWLRAESIDGSGVNNANMATPSDGRSPRMQMYVWNTANPTRDCALDTTIVAHEYGHYVSNRLIGNALGIANTQGYGLGEGWADFHGALLAAEAADANLPSNENWGGVFSLAAYSTNDPYFGIRQFPLSSTMTINPLTFRHIDGLQPRPTGAPARYNGNPNYFVHNTGEVWAAMLWDCFVALLNDPRYTFDSARERMKRYLIAAYKVTPMTPHFVEARDALLTVAAAQDADDYLLFWTAFAKRGIGGGAIAPDRYDWANRRVTESFTVQNSVRVVAVAIEEAAGSCDGDGVLDADEDGVIRVTVRNLGTTSLVSGAAKVTVATTPAGLSFPSGPTVDVPALAASALVTLEIPVSVEHLLGPRPLELSVTAAGANLFPPSVTTRQSVLLNYDERQNVSTSDDFEVATSGWAPGADTQLNVTSSFRRLAITPTQHFWFAPPGASASDVWLTSPPLEVGATAFTVNFLHRFEFEREGATFFDGAVIEVSTDDGATWADVSSVVANAGYTGTLSTQLGNPLSGRQAFAGRSDAFPAFEATTLSFGTSLANQTVRLRFRVGSDDLQRQSSRGWEIDDVTVTGLENTPFPKLSLDANVCTNTAPVVTVEPSRTVQEGERVVLQGNASDAEADPLSLTWSQMAGRAGVLTGNVFIAPQVEADEAVTLMLVAHDGRVASAPASLTLTVQNVNRAPTVTVPRAQTVKAGDVVSLTATASDVDREPLSFTWSQTSGPAVSLEGADSLNVRFTAPSLAARDVVVLRFVANDGKVDSMAGTVNITVEADDAAQPPPEPEPMKGCGCTSSGGLVTMALVLFFRRRLK